MKLKYGTRGSKLALHQTRYAIDILKKASQDIEFEEVIIKTLGDKVTGLPLFKVGGQGLFIKEIEQALLEKRIDIAVHSLKDVPSVLAEGLTIAAIGCAEDPRDSFISHKYKSFEEMPEDAIIGTSSLRRRSQLSVLKPNAKFSDFRGNLDTRLRKLEEGEVDAIILAAAGISRFGWQNKITHFFGIDELTPAAGQGLLAIECRKEDEEKLKPILSAFIDEKAMIRSRAERTFLEILQGGCQTPMAVYAEVSDKDIILHSFIGSPDGKDTIRNLHSGHTNKPEELGKEAAETILEMGGDRFIGSENQQ